MDEHSLGRRLAALAPPDVDGARGRARTAAGSMSLGPRPSGPRQAAARHVTATVVLAASLLLAAGALLTAPGHAVTSWVGEQLGLGHPGEHPTLRRLGHFAREGTIGDGQAAYVLVRGPAPHGDHYEFVTYRSNRSGEHCFELDLPKNRSVSGGGCEELGTRFALPSENGIVVGPSGGGRGRTGAVHFVAGRISEDIDSVRVAFNGRPAGVELREPPAWLLEELGFARPFKFFIAFLGSEVELGGEITTSAVRDGAVVAHGETLKMPNVRRTFRETCRNALRSAAAGKLSNRNARRICRSLGLDPDTARAGGLRHPQRG